MPNSNLPIAASSKTPTTKFPIPQITLISDDAPTAGGEAKGGLKSVARNAIYEMWNAVSQKNSRKKVCKVKILGCNLYFN